MILDAKLASETKVGKEVQKIKQKMEVLPRCFVWRFVPLIQAANRGLMMTGCFTVGSGRKTLLHMLKPNRPWLRRSR